MALLKKAKITTSFISLSLFIFKKNRKLIAIKIFFLKLYVNFFNYFC